MIPSRTVHLALYDTLSDWEIGYAVGTVNSPFWERDWRWQVRTVGETTDPVTSIGGVRMLPDSTLADLSPGDSELLILPGAAMWDAGGGAAFTAKAREFLDAGVPVAAICGATFGLARDGLLDDRAHTSAAPQYLAASGYAGGHLYRDEPAIIDGDLVTAGPAHAVDFARAIFTRLALFDPAKVDAWYRLYGQGDTAGFFELAS